MSLLRKRPIRKFPSLKSELQKLVSDLKTKPETGIALGNQCFKIRIAIVSKGKGKSGGGRVITCFKVFSGTVYLLTIFDKSEQESIGDKELKELLAEIP